MTTASAQKRTQQPPTVQDQPAQPRDAGNQIPVLIRLPDLGTSMLTVGAGSQVEPDQAPSPSHAASSRGSAGGGPPTMSDSEASSTQPPATVNKQQDRGSWWTNFHVPSSVVHALVAVALIAVFIAAYMAIVGGGDDGQEIAADQPAAEGKTAANAKNGTASGQGNTAQDSKPAVPKAPKKPAPTGSRPTAPPPAKPTGKAAKQPSAGQPAGKPKQPPAPKEDQLASTPKQPTTKAASAPKADSPVAASQPDANIRQTEFKSPADSATAQPAAGNTPLNSSPTERPASFRNENPYPQDLTANDVSAGGPAERPAGTGPAASTEERPVDWPAMYPVTNPASYQYPADYHERLLSPAGGQGLQRDASWSAGGAGAGQRPSTARLQPRIEAPPVR